MATQVSRKGGEAEAGRARDADAGATSGESSERRSTTLPDDDAPVAAKRRRKPFVIFAVVVGLGLLLLGAFEVLSAGKEDTDDAEVWADMVPVATRVAGLVVSVHVKENQDVKKGEVLAEIDDADYAARCKQAEAEVATSKAQAAAADAQAQVVVATSRGGLASARAGVSGSAVGVSGAEAQVLAAKAGQVRAEAELRKAEIDLKRTKELFASTAVSQQVLDNAQAAYDSASAVLAGAKAQMSAAEESRRAAQTRVGEAEGRLTQSAPVESQIAAAHANADLAHARVKSAEASLDLARLQLSYTKILAPADGKASKLSVHEGQLLSMGQPVIELVPAVTYVLANFKETQIGEMKPGQRAVITIDAFPRRHFEGRVDSLSGGTGASFSLLPADNASGNYVKVVQRVPVRIAWVDPPPPSEVPLRAGLSADVVVYVK